MSRKHANTIAILIVSLMLISSFGTVSFDVGYGQEGEMTFTTGERIGFTSTAVMGFKDPESMQFWSGVQMQFSTNTTVHFTELSPDGILQPCDILIVVWPAGYEPLYCSWWTVIDPVSG